jgi:nicotinamidase/pyrazinamidase
VSNAAKRSALIVTDVQNDFCPGGSLPVPRGDEVVPLINRLMQRFEIVVASQDWHPIGHISFASTHPGKKPFDTIPLMGEEQILWPDHCVPGTRGAEFHPGLDTRPIVLIVRKGWHMHVDSYSTFFENDYVTPTGLEPYLRGLGVRRVYLTGLAQDFCVYYSAMDALRLGFETFMIDDATRGLDQPRGSLEAKMQDARDRGLRSIKADDVVKAQR